MRIAVVSPYSWTYPGGVTRHIEALAEQYLSEGHEVRVLAPFDPPDLIASIMHRGARPQLGTAPDYLVSLGRTVGVKANGSMSNLSLSPTGVARLRRELRGRRLRRSSPPRAGRADDRMGGIAAAATAAGRDVPLLLQQVAPEHARQRVRRAPDPQPPPCPDRCLGGRRLDRQALVRRSLSGDSQRRARDRRHPRSVSELAQRQSPADRFRRTVGRAKGTAAAASRVRGAA